MQVAEGKAVSEGTTILDATQVAPGKYAVLPQDDASGESLDEFFKSNPVWKEYIATELWINKRFKQRSEGMRAFWAKQRAGV